ncbi:hypothetical protein WEI85_27945 [Actinomycetes bacterium KLBMP 9797]
MTLPPLPAPPSLPAEPPVGPGVTPPFAAPPTEGRTLRLWLALGVAGLAAVLCCGAGGAALVGVVITSTEAINEQVEAVVGDYYAAVRDERYQEAYDLLCDELRDDETQREFADRVSREPIRSYEVGDAAIAEDLSVPVNVTYADGDQRTVEVTMVQDTGTGELEVCGFDG